MDIKAETNSEKSSKGPDEMSDTRHRKLPLPLQLVFYVFIILSVLVAVSYFFGLKMFGFYFAEYQYYFILIALLMPFVFLLLPAQKTKVQKIPWYDYLVALTIFVINIYFSFYYYTIQQGLWTMDPPILALIFAVLLILFSMESARRAGGNVFMAVCIVLSAIPLLSDKLPGIISSPSFDWNMLVGHIAFDSEGFMGLPMKVIGGTLFGFLIFAGLLVRTGAGDFFLKLATSLGGHARGGVAKVAVIGSAFFGSLSGSVFANIVGTGSITIPGMKKSGFPDYYAGAVEACASTGGVLMPPVMGAVAFVMASMTQIPYSKILVAALIPSVLFYFSLIVQVDCFAARKGIKGIPKDQLPKASSVLKDGWQFLFVLIFLVWGLLVLRLEALTPFYASAFLLIITAVMYKKTGFNFRKLISVVEGVGNLLVDTMAIILPLAPVVAGLLITGIAPAFTAGILRLSGGTPFIALLLGLIACYIMGMAGLLVSAYIFLALGLAPALIGCGFNVLAVHLFIIYYAMLSSITPPVAAGAFLASNIAEAQPMKTALQSMKLGIALYFIPFFFVYEPALVMQGEFLNIAISIGTALIGVFLIASGVEGYIYKVGVLENIIERIVIVIIGLLFAIPSYKISFIGLILALLYIVYKTVVRRKVLVDL